MTRFAHRRHAGPILEGGGMVRMDTKVHSWSPGDGTFKNCREALDLGHKIMEFLLRRAAYGVSEHFSLTSLAFDI